MTRSTAGQLLFATATAAAFGIPQVVASGQGVLAYGVTVLIVFATMAAMWAYGRSRTDARWRYRVGSAVVVVGSVGASLLLGSPGWQEVTLSNEPVHLGDVTSDVMVPAAPLEADSVSWLFRIEARPGAMAIDVIAKDVDPDLRNGPVEVCVNGVRVAFLNDRAPFAGKDPRDEHRADAGRARIEVPLGYLKVGWNRLTLRVLRTPYGLDDVNVMQVKLRFRGTQ